MSKGPESDYRRHRTMHVAHVVLTLDVGGLERNVVNQVREGRRIGQRVTVVCLEHPGTLAPRVEQLGATVLALGKGPGLKPAMIWRLARHFRRLRPDVVHTHQLATLLYAGAAARLLRVPVVIHTEHGREAYATRWRTRALGRVAGSFCDRFYCLTTNMAEEIQAARIVPSRKLRRIENGIDVSSFAGATFDRDAIRSGLGIPTTAPVIGTVGRLNEVKRQDVLIRAFALVRQRLPDAHLVLVGDGPLLADLRSLAGQLGVMEAVHFVGYQPHSGPFLKSMDVFALTSRSEGMPQAVIEASIMGLPVVASRVGGLPEVVQDGVTGTLFEAGDHAALAAALTHYLVDADIRHHTGAAAAAHATSRFDVARMASEYHRDCLAILRRGTPASRVPRGATHSRLAALENVP